jgi:hypothetical protein
MSRLKIALEKELEVDKVFDLKRAANSSREFDTLYTKTKQENDLAEQDQEDTISDDISNDEEVLDDDSIAEESFKNIVFENLALEDFDILSRLGNKVTEVLSLALHNLSELGITYSPIILTKVYKGVLFLMSKIVSLLFNSISSLNKYIIRHNTSFSKLKEDISSIKKMLDELPESNGSIDSKFTNKRVIDCLVISDGVDIAANIGVLVDFIGPIVNKISDSINNDVSSIKHLISYSYNGVVKIPSSIMGPSSYDALLSSGSLKGYERSSDMVSSYHYQKTLPGNVLFIAQLPNDDLTELPDIIEAYNNSTMFLGYDADSYKVIDSIDYMSKEGLLNLLSKLDELCGLCIKDEVLYETILSKKKSLRYNFKNYFNALISKSDKVSIKDSLLEYVYLKSIFIDKVYTSTAIDIHDYTAKVITNALVYIKDNANKL